MAARSPEKLHPQPETGWDMTTYQFHNGTYRVHEERTCDGPCPFHNPTRHEMAEWPMHWDEEMHTLHRLCPHGFPHPDPDSVRWVHGTSLCVDQKCPYRSHFCDGCCHIHIPIQEILADLRAIAEATK